RPRGGGADSLFGGACSLSSLARWGCNPMLAANSCSRTTLRHRPFRPLLEVLEDRLQPGSVLPWFEWSLLGASLSDWDPGSSMPPDGLSQIVHQSNFEGDKSLLTQDTSTSPASTVPISLTQVAPKQAVSSNEVVSTPSPSRVEDSIAFQASAPRLRTAARS